MPYTPTQILLGFVAPAVALALICALARLRWLPALVTTAAFAIACKTAEPKIGWPPTANAVYLLFYLPILAGLLTLADSLLRPPLWLRAVVLVLFWRFALWLLLQKLIPSSFSSTAAEIWTDLSTLILLFWWLTFETLADRSPRIATPLFLALISFASAVVLALGWHIQTSGALAGITALYCLAALFSKRIPLTRGFAQTIVVILQLLLVHGFFFTDDTLTTAQQFLVALLILTPLLAFLGDLPAAKNSRPILRLAIRLIPALIVVATLCSITVRQYLQAEQSSASASED